MLGYIFEWFIFILIVGFIYKTCGLRFGREDICLFTAIWGVANLCISLKK